MDCMAASIACSALLDFGDKHKSMTANARGILPSESLHAWQHQLPVHSEHMRQIS